MELSEAQHLRVRVLLTVQAALLLEIRPSVRQIGVGWSDKHISLWMLHEGEPDEDAVESASCVETEIIASFPYHDVRVFAVRYDLSKRSPRMDGVQAWVYARWEPDVRYGLYPWFEEHGIDEIHPDDLAQVRTLEPYGKVFQRVREDAEFIRLRYEDVEFRVRPFLFRSVEGIVHDIGEIVLLKDGGRGEITGVHWHHERNEPMYEVRIVGKNKSRRYWNSDFT